jgi:hypothetical protein
MEHDLATAGRRLRIARDHAGERVGCKLSVLPGATRRAVGGSVQPISLFLDPVHERNPEIGRKPEVPPDHAVAIATVTELPQRLMPLVQGLPVAFGCQAHLACPAAQRPYRRATGNVQQVLLVLR